MYSPLVDLLNACDVAGTILGTRNTRQDNPGSTGQRNLQRWNGFRCSTGCRGWYRVFRRTVKSHAPRPGDLGKIRILEGVVSHWSVTRITVGEIGWVGGMLQVEGLVPWRHWAGISERDRVRMSSISGEGDACCMVQAGNRSQVWIFHP